jgi:hypothetical protein
MRTNQDSLDLFGTCQVVPHVELLTAGAWSCELKEGQLQNIRWNDVEVIRGISYLFRDSDWGTIPAEITDKKVCCNLNIFNVQFQLCMKTSQGTLSCLVRLFASNEGLLEFEVRAMASSEMLTNRCGFVVLHPAAAAGCPLTVEHTNGQLENIFFPLEISPSQPVFDIRSLNYQPVIGLKLKVLLEAQLPHDSSGKYEMEDQRNWSDASFKTYVASLLDPWPYCLPSEVELTQRVSLRVNDSVSRTTNSDATNLQRGITFGPKTGYRMPAIGVGVPPGIHKAKKTEWSALIDLNADWWIVELDLEDPELFEDIQALVHLRSEKSVKVQGDFICINNMSAHQSVYLAANLCSKAKLELDAVRFLPAALLKSFQPIDQWPDVPSHEELVSAARTVFPFAKIGSGAYTSFTELNRRRPCPSTLDFIGHLTCPIIHAPDDVSVMQTIEALPHIARSIRKFFPNVPYRLGPSTLAPRRNPYGNDTIENSANERIALAALDPRHQAAYGAAWVIAYAAAVVDQNVEVLSLLESHGPNGPIAKNLPTDKTDITVPAWHALGLLVSVAGQELLTIKNLPPQLAGVAWLSEDGARRCVLANLTDLELPVNWTEDSTITRQLPSQLKPFEVMNI